MPWFISGFLGFSATAGDLAYHDTEPKNRSYKVEVYLRAPMPGKTAWSSDWRDTDLELWSAILHCTRTRPKFDECTFDKGLVVFGQHIVGEERNRYYHLAVPATLEVRWKGTQGGVASWRFDGDMKAFWRVGSQALADRFREEVYYKPDGQRQLGQLLEAALAFNVLGALEFELPRKGGGEIGEAWQVKTPPASARTWRSSTVAGKISAKEESREGDVATLYLSGRGSETLSSASLASGAVEWTIESRARLDVKRHMLIQSHSRVLFTRQMPGHYVERNSFMAEATNDMTAEPGQLHHLLPVLTP